MVLFILLTVWVSQFLIGILFVPLRSSLRSSSLKGNAVSIPYRYSICSAQSLIGSIATAPVQSQFLIGILFVPLLLRLSSLKLSQKSQFLIGILFVPLQVRKIASLIPRLVSIPYRYSICSAQQYTSTGK